MSTKTDTLGLIAALERAIEQARELRPEPKATPAPCLCGSTDDRGTILAEPLDLGGDDVAVIRNEGGRPCRACQHYIRHEAMCVRRYYGPTTTVRDHFHPSCVRL